MTFIEWWFHRVNFHFSILKDFGFLKSRLVIVLYNSGVVFRVCVGSMECNFPFAMHFFKGCTRVNA